VTADCREQERHRINLQQIAHVQLIIHGDDVCFLADFDCAPGI
jgi:hypothetical protein